MALFDQVCGPGDHIAWHRQAERPGRAKVNHQLEFVGLPDW
jgi:hypothetical protein